jgi:DNA polymerase-3 subunit alpha
MDIEVLPPNVNFSCWGFTIENNPQGEYCIRFGLGAVKNVGEGPVEEIVQGRGEIPFKDVNDLLRRVDMRKVGKRALESLIQVGALDDLGNRPALLESMDRIIAISSSNFQASEAGQVSMFGEETGLTETISLTEAKTKISHRAQLDWERELIGLYVSDHPLSAVMDSLQQHVTHFAQDLNEAKHQERVSVAGIVTKIRQHQTKNGKAMAFATIEDIQGMIDLVIFPNTWKKYSDMIRFDEIIYVKGKADANGGDTKVLVDQVSTSIIQVDSVPEQPRPSIQSPPETPPIQTTLAPPVEKPSTEIPARVEEKLQVKESPPGNIPPPPEAFSPEWKNETTGVKENENEEEEEEKKSPTPPVLEEPASSRPGPIILEEDATYLLTILLKNRGDTMRDKLRLRQVYGTLISYPGKDRFTFQITENEQSHLLEFPNASTNVTKELINHLRDMLGRDNVQVEKYLF